MTRDPRAGFVLAVTLWFLAAVAVGAGFFSYWTEGLLREARESLGDLDGDINESSTLATLYFLLTTEPIKQRGIVLSSTDEDLTTTPVIEDEAMFAEERTPDRKTKTNKAVILLDDQPYLGIGTARFSIQDESGLLDINNLRKSNLKRLLVLLGVESGRTEALIDKLEDYIDADDKHRLNGAESSHYQELGLSPPANRRLFTSWEARNILDWGGQASLWVDNRLPRTTSVHGALPNFNYAPSLALQTFSGIDADTASKIIAARRIKPFNTAQEAYTAAERVFRVMEMEMAFYPTAYQRVTLWNDRGRRMRELHLELQYMNQNATAPLSIDYEIVLSLSEELQREELQPVQHYLFKPSVSARSK